MQTNVFPGNGILNLKGYYDIMNPYYEALFSPTYRTNWKCLFVCWSIGQSVGLS